MTLLPGLHTAQYPVGLVPHDAPPAFLVRVTWSDGSQWYHARPWGPMGFQAPPGDPMTRDRASAHVFTRGDYCPAWDAAGVLSPDAEIVPVPNEADMTNPVKQLVDALNESGATIQVGLRQQGHMPTVMRMLDEDASWDDIGKAIGWHGPTVREWYERESAFPAFPAAPHAAAREGEGPLTAQEQEALAMVEEMRGLLAMTGREPSGRESDALVIAAAVPRIIDALRIAEAERARLEGELRELGGRMYAEVDKRVRAETANLRYDRDVAVQQRDLLLNLAAQAEARQPPPPIIVKVDDAEFKRIQALASTPTTENNA